jgi:hypothetical protein
MGARASQLVVSRAAERVIDFAGALASQHEAHAAA